MFNIIKALFVFFSLPQDSSVISNVCINKDLVALSHGNNINVINYNMRQRVYSVKVDGSVNKLNLFNNHILATYYDETQERHCTLSKFINPHCQHVVNQSEFPYVFSGFTLLNGFTCCVIVTLNGHFKCYRENIVIAEGGLDLGDSIGGIDVTKQYITVSNGHHEVKVFDMLSSNSNYNCVTLLIPTSHVGSLVYLEDVRSVHLYDNKLTYCTRSSVHLVNIT